MALVPKLLLLASGLLGLVEGSAKVVPMSFNKQKRDGHDLARRAASLSVDLGNAFTNGLYFVNATVGTPGQNVALQIDTGSSDIWMFGPQSCDVQTSDCLGGNCEYILCPPGTKWSYSVTRFAGQICEFRPWKHLAESIH